MLEVDRSGALFISFSAQQDNGLSPYLLYTADKGFKHLVPDTIMKTSDKTPRFLGCRDSTTSMQALSHPIDVSMLCIPLLHSGGSFSMTAGALIVRALRN